MAARLDAWGAGNGGASDRPGDDHDCRGPDTCQATRARVGRAADRAVAAPRRFGDLDLDAPAARSPEHVRRAAAHAILIAVVLRGHAVHRRPMGLARARVGHVRLDPSRACASAAPTPARRAGASGAAGADRGRRRRWLHRRDGRIRLDRAPNRGASGDRSRMATVAARDGGSRAAHATRAKCRARHGVVVRDRTAHLVAAAALRDRRRPGAQDIERRDAHCHVHARGHGVLVVGAVPVC